MIAQRIKYLREQAGMTQAELARKLYISRSSVNAWEMEISAPSVQSVIDLAAVFKVSTDYLLGVDASASLYLDGLTEEDVQIIHHLVTHLRRKNEAE